MFFEATAPFFSTLQKKGLNVLGGFTPHPHEYDSILPDCTSVVIVANYGRALFEQFVTEIVSDHTVLNMSQHPLDDFVENVIQQTMRSDQNFEMMNQGVWELPETRIFFLAVRGESILIEKESTK